MNNTNTKIALGGIALFIVGIAGGAIYSQPKDNLPVGAGEVVEETVTINDDGKTAKEKLVVTIETPSVQTISFTQEDLDRQVEKIALLRNNANNVLQAVIIDLNKETDETRISELSFQKNKIEAIIANYDSATAYYEGLNAKAEPELDKLPARVEATPVVDEVVDQPFNPDEGLEGSVN